MYFHIYREYICQLALSWSLLSCSALYYEHCFISFRKVTQTLTPLFSNAVLLRIEVMNSLRNNTIIILFSSNSKLVMRTLFTVHLH